MADKIKAVVMTGPGKVETQKLPWPELKPGGLILKMNMAGICGTDKHAYRGESILYGGTEAEQEIVYPGVRGHENVGTIVEIRKEDQDSIEYHGTRLKVGDRVTMCPNIICKQCWYCRHVFAFPFCAENTTIGLSFKSTEWPYVAGGWADYMYVPAGSWVYKIPDEMTDEMAALTELMVVAATLDRAKEFSRLEARGFGFADTVGIQGCGPIGLMHIIKAKMLGAWQIVAIDPSEEKLRLAKEFGATHTINVNEVKDPLAAIMEITGGRGRERTYECAGNDATFDLCMRSTMRGHVMTCVSFYKQPVKAALDYAVLNGINIMTVRGEGRNNCKRALSLMSQGKIKTKQILTHTFPLDDFATAYDYFVNRKDGAMKVVVLPQGK